MKNLVMEHYRNPRNTADLSGLSEEHQYENPSCGDWVRLEITLGDDRVSGMQFQGEGCSLSIAAASMLTDFLSGKPADTAKSLAEQFISEITDPDTPFSLGKWGDLECFEEIKGFPIRQRCVVLPFTAFLEELKSLKK